MITIWSFLLIIGITIYIAFMYQSTVMMLVLFLEAVLFVVALVSVLFRCTRIRGTIEIPVGIAERGLESLVKLVINNRGIFPMRRMKVLLVVKDVMRGKKKKYRMTLPIVPRGESEYIQAVSFYGTGSYEISLRKLQIHDITGILSGTVRVKKQDTIRVLPEYYDVPVRLTPTVRNFYGEADVYDEKHPGHDKSELFQVREYRAGDRLQNVHWKLTAKQEEWIVKEYSLPKACPVILFLSYQPRRRKRLLSFLEAAVSLSFSIMDAGCPHYVAWYDEEEQDVMRVRVDDEESLFYMIGIIMKVTWGRNREDRIQRYKEKYRQEPYIWMLTLDEKLQFYKGKDLLIRYSGKNLQESLSEIELVL